MRKIYDVEIITFVKGRKVATIATNGNLHVSQEPSGIAIGHRTLWKAIGYLETKGFRIRTDVF